MRRVPWSGLGAYLVRHPADVVVLARAGWRFRARSWWRHAPYLPVPDAAYWHFRMTTYGADGATPLPAQAMVDAARWTLRQPVSR